MRRWSGWAATYAAVRSEANLLQRGALGLSFAYEIPAILHQFWCIEGEFGKILQNYINSLRKVPIMRLWREIGAYLQDFLAPITDPVKKLHFYSIFGRKTRIACITSQVMGGNKCQRPRASTSRHPPHSEHEQTLADTPHTQPTAYTSEHQRTVSNTRNS